MIDLPPLTARTALTHWSPAWISLPLIALIGLAYLTGVGRLRHEGRSWPVGRTISFVGLGLGSWVVATMSFLGAYAHELFWVYATQLIMLLTVTPALLALGAPLTLAELALPTSWAERARNWPNSTLGRVTTFPLVGTILLTAVPFAVYFTGLFEFLMRHQVAYHVGQPVFVLIGFLFFWPMLSSDDLRRWPWPLATLIVFAETTFDSVPGIVIWLSTRLIAPTYYAEVGRTWGRSQLSDQKFGGVMLWAVGEVVGIPLLIMMVTQWMRADERDAARIDRELDAAAGLIPETIDSEPTARLSRTAADPVAASDADPAATVTVDPPGTVAVEPGTEATAATSGPEVGEPDDDLGPGLELPWWRKDPSQLRRGGNFDW